LVLVQFWGVWEDTPEWCFPLVGLWWIGFAQFTSKVLPNGNKKKQKVDRKVLAHGFKELINVYKEMRKHRRLKTFLSSFFVYSMGIQTVMLMAVMYAKKELGVDQTVLISSVLIIQFVAIGGAYLFSWLSKKIGNIKTLMLGLIVWILGCVYAYLLKDPMQFYLLAGLIGLVMGGSQALSRSTYSKYLPETEDTASYFSFFDITEKIGIIIGMVVFGVLEGLVDMRVSVLSLVVFFVVGFLLLFRVPKESKIQQENV
jgi:UMF1 family MFS transporter